MWPHDDGLKWHHLVSGGGAAGLGRGEPVAGGAGPDDGALDGEAVDDGGAGPSVKANIQPL
jgi:hypothetical protein